jgi:leucyl-tRNA synthetase
MKQWMLRITKYAERLLNDLNQINWPDNIKEQQRNWIGRATGAEIVFKLERRNERLHAFTTRPDTLFGVTFFVVSPEHPLVPLLSNNQHKENVKKYCEEARKLSDFDRTVENRKKTGVFTGSYVINPITREPVPVYVGDYVLMSYGTGAVMGVPAHDERDFEFARTFQISIRPVIVPQDGDEELRQAVMEGEIAWTQTGIMLPNLFPIADRLGLTGLSNKEAGERIVRWLNEHNSGRWVVTYKLRDWLFSRQRYWGEPIPIIHWEDGRMTPVAEHELPLKLPLVQDYKPSEGGESPLAKAEEWLWVTDPKSGIRGRRETNTMPQWAGSCWYYLRFADPCNSSQPWDRKAEHTWMPVDLYVGGAEHAVLHLLYARFWHKVLFDLGFVSTNEPFQRLFNQGMILAYAYKNRRGALVPVDEVQEDQDGIPNHKVSGEELEKIVAKMSKSLRNVINPDDIIRQYGADTLRMYLMFMGPLDSSRVWDSQAIMGNYRFLKRVWALYTGNRDEGLRQTAASAEEPREVQRALHACIKKVTEDIEVLQFNTAISAMMEFVNTQQGRPVSVETLEKFLLLLSVFAPHIGEEQWQRLGHVETIAYQEWPKYDEAMLNAESASVVVQVNGKKRGLIDVAANISEDDLKQAVIAAMAETNYPVSTDDRFIVVKQQGGSAPKLVNVITCS